MSDKIAFLRFEDGAATIPCQKEQYDEWVKAAKWWGLDFNGWAKVQLLMAVRQKLGNQRLPPHLETVRKVAGKRGLSKLVRDTLDAAAKRTQYPRR